MITKTPLLVTLLLTMVSFSAGSPKNNEPGSEWDKIVDEFFREYYAMHPSQGTTAGFHQYDSELEDYSRKGVDEEVALSTRYLDRFDKFDPSRLNIEQRQDQQLVVNNLKSTLLELQSIRSWEKNPDKYSSGITQSAFGIMSRKFASPDVRLRSLIQREKKMPEVFTAARKNWKNPPRIYTEVAIQQLPGLLASSKRMSPPLSPRLKTSNSCRNFSPLMPGSSLPSKSTKHF